MNFSDYDLYKLATPPEYEREEPEAPSAEKKKKRRGGIPAGEYCPGCGAVSDGRHLDRALLPKEEEDIKW